MSSRRRTIPVSTYDDRVVRLSLGDPSYGTTSGKLVESMTIGTGVFARALWVGRKHVVLLTYSQWVDRHGCATGDGYRLCEPEDIYMIRSRFGNDAADDAMDAMHVPVMSIDGEVLT